VPDLSKRRLYTTIDRKCAMIRRPVNIKVLGTHACAVSRILASTMDEISSAEKRFFSPLYSTVCG
jgi:hypothetical protein